MEILIKTENPEELSKEWIKVITLLLKGTLENMKNPAEVYTTDTGDTTIEINLPKSNYREYQEHLGEMILLWNHLMEVAITMLPWIAHNDMSQYEKGISELRKMDTEFRALIGYKGRHIIEQLYR
jgi:hypothetical protein